LARISRENRIEFLYFPPRQGMLVSVNGKEMSEPAVLFISADPAASAQVEAAVRGNFPGDAAGSGFGTAIEWTHVEALFDGLRELQERSFDLILSDLFVPDGQGLATLRHLQQHAPNIPVIALCHVQDRDTGVTAVRKGAYDFFCYEDLIPANLRKSMESAMDHALVEAEKKAAEERRNNARFPCRLAVSYQTLEHPVFSGQGTSETLNISSKGMLFTSNEQFQAGQLVQVSLDWPARLENQIPLKLVAEGRIVRNSNGQTAMTIDKYEFRTRKTAPKAGAVAAGVKQPAFPNRGPAPGRTVAQPGAVAPEPGTVAAERMKNSPQRRPF
jgi:DNA-binding NarL/FixJ family response regulator